MKKVIVYTDGACFGNPGPGGWGVLLFYNGYEHELYGGESQSTNNRMELKAVIEALNFLKESCKIDLYTDSIYVSKGISQWIERWKKNGWKTADRKPVKNNELWQQLDLVRMRHRVVWHWIKGHASIIGNERADALARKGVQLNQHKTFRKI